MSRARGSAAGAPAPITPRTVVLASASPAKRVAVARALGRCFEPAPELTCAALASGVPDQPVGDAETLRGAENRATAALARLARGGREPALALGVEGGVEEARGAMWAFAWVVARDADGRRGAARSATFALPPEVTALVRAGLELGDANDRVFGVHGSKHDQGAVGLLSLGRVDRPSLYEDAVVLALLPFLRPELYPAAPG